MNKSTRDRRAQQRTREHVDRAMAKARREGLSAIEASPDFDRAMADDAAFFATHPSRSYRVRAATPADIAEVVTFRGEKLPAVPPRPFKYHVAVHRSGPGRCTRQILVGTGNPSGCWPESRARGLWEMFLPREFLCLRLPIGPDGYASETAAVVALKDFAGTLDLDLGQPDVVGVGDTVYGVWRFSDPVPIGPWVEIATTLGRRAQVYGLRLDGPVSGELPFDLDMCVPGALGELGL